MATDLKQQCCAILVAGITAAFGILAGLSDASAQDVQSVIDRMNSLERNVTDIQRQVFGPGAQPRSGTISSQPLANSQSKPSTADSAFAQVPMLARHQIQLQQLESQMRVLTGQIESVNYNVEQFGKRLDRLVSDVDFRLQSLESALSRISNGAPPATVTTGNSTPPAVAANVPPGSNQSSNTAVPNSDGVENLIDDRGTRVIGQVTVPETPSSNAAATQAAAVTAPPPSVLPAGTPREQYDFAFEVLRSHDYQGAEAAFTAFLEQNATDPLAGNAQYWLGESYYVQKRFEEAAVAFAAGYQNYPTGSKAPDNLLKLAMSLGAIGKTAQACVAFKQFTGQFPGAPENLHKRARSEERKLGCGG